MQKAGQADVYNMEVQETHNFAVENGAIVHNCYDETRYFLMGWPSASRECKQTKPRVFDPLER